MNKDPDNHRSKGANLLVMQDMWQYLTVEDKILVCLYVAFYRLLRDQRLGVAHHVCKKAYTGYNTLTDNQQHNIRNAAIILFSMIASGAIIWIASQNWALGVVLALIVGVLIGRILR